jgi:DNA invertase Pin-like site-specific DNA recombinase
MTEKEPPNRRIGYARVSTYGQTLGAQLDQLQAAGCAKIYREKVTGARADRRELLRLLKALAPGNVVTVTRIDRLPARPSTCSPSSSRSSTSARNSDHWRNRGPTPAQAPGA